MDPFTCTALRRRRWRRDQAFRRTFCWRPTALHRRARGIDHRGESPGPHGKGPTGNSPFFLIATIINEASANLDSVQGRGQPAPSRPAPRAPIHQRPLSASTLARRPDDRRGQRGADHGPERADSARRRPFRSGTYPARLPSVSQEPTGFCRREALVFFWRNWARRSAGGLNLRRDRRATA
jgi:hypothetical protein